MYTARFPARAKTVHVTQHVGVATDVSIVVSDAPAEFHAAVVGVM